MTKVILTILTIDFVMRITLYGKYTYHDLAEIWKKWTTKAEKPNGKSNPQVG